MFTLIVDLTKLLRAIWHGFRTDEEFRILLYMLLILLGGATLFYTRIEHWSVVDSLYFSIMTMSTIGYGDLTPHTAVGKVITMIYSFIGIAMAFYFVSLISHYVFEKRIVHRLRFVKKKKA